MNKFDILHTIRGGHMGIINDLCRIDDDMIASTCADHMIRIFNLHNPKFDDPVLTFE